jgi:hypothetical protein
MTGAQFEIRIDGTPRTYRDRKDYAMEAARLIKSKESAQHNRSQRLAKWRRHRGGPEAGVSDAYTPIHYKHRRNPHGRDAGGPGSTQYRGLSGREGNRTPRSHLMHRRPLGRSLDPDGTLRPSV